MLQLFPVCRPVSDPLAIYDDLHLPEPPVDRAYVSLNMVSSADGRAQLGERAAGLGSSVDQALMLRLRAQADCILNGSGTIHADKVFKKIPDHLIAQRRARGQSDEPRWAVVTGSGDLPREAKIFHRQPRPIVFIAKQTPTDRRAWLEEHADVIVAGDERPDMANVVSALRTRFGCRHVLCEGGPTLNHSLLARDLVDELFLTFAPKLAAGSGKTIVAGEQFPAATLPELRLITMYERESELFLRYRVGPR